MAAFKSARNRDYWSSVNWTPKNIAQPMPIKPMSPEEVLEKQLVYGATERDIRTALASVIAWATEECRPEFKRAWATNHTCDLCGAESYCDGYNEATDLYQAALLKAAEEIGGV